MIVPIRIPPAPPRPVEITDRMTVGRIRRLWGHGLDTAQIAARIGRTEAQVYNVLARGRHG